MWVALKFNDNDYYPIVSLHLRIFTINAIASTSAERSFTAVKYLRSYFRTTMAEERQNGIAINKRRTKLYCSEISKKLFPDYYGRRTTERNCSNVHIHSDFSNDIDLKFAYEKAGKVCCENRCKTGKPWNESAFVANTAKLYLLIRRECEAWQKIIRRINITDDSRLDCTTASMLSSSISNLRKPVFNATCAVSVFYANWA
ncbi:hypothetical protein T07_9415 [Trichinella nelsoni]|uniref:HAT C-terminal dimerisation domain-containing protein n=1 Tax=Trichinella nelsoni TaxID=6336 RepID=A0A0V0RM86_9BILA|nr:hypothetical protein T07_9415 [Trichinella nelsoni]